MNTDNLFSETFYGNTILDWAISLAIIVGSILVGKIVYWFCSKTLKRFTKNTKTKFDDIIIDMIEEPLVVIVVVVGIWYSLGRLSFSVGITEFIANSMNATVILTVTWMITRLLDALIEQYIVPLTAQSETDLDDMILPVLRKASRAMIWALGIIVALNNAGIQIAPLIAGLGIGGLALAMAAKDTVANFFGGFTIFTDKPFKVGDRIKVGDFDGSIYEVGLRSSRMRTLEGRMVTIPNARIADSMIENVSEEPTRKVVNKLGLVYDVNADQIRQAIDLLKGIGTDTVAKIDENVIVGFTGFGDSALELTFIYYIRSGEDIIGVQTEINLKIMEQFAANKLDFAYPSQTIYTKSID
jgi:MscS family membrane protein